MSLVFVRGIHQWSVDSPHKGPVTQQMFPFDDVIMMLCAYFMGYTLCVTSEDEVKAERYIKTTVLLTAPWLTCFNIRVRGWPEARMACYRACKEGKKEIEDGRINALFPRQNATHFTDNIFKDVFFKENFHVLISVSSKVFSCDQAALQMVFSVCPSVRLSVRLSVTPFWICSHHRIIMKFSGIITNDKSKVHAKGQGQRSKVKVTEVTIQLNCFRTVTPVWIHIWWRNDAYSLMLLRRGALFFFKVIRQISRSHGSKIVKFDPDWAFPDCDSSLNSPMATKWSTKLEIAEKRCTIVFQGHPSSFKVTRL